MGNADTHRLPPTHRLAGRSNLPGNPGIQRNPDTRRPRGFQTPTGSADSSTDSDSPTTDSPNHRSEQSARASAVADVRRSNAELLDTTGACARSLRVRGYPVRAVADRASHVRAECPPRPVQQHDVAVSMARSWSVGSTGSPVASSWGGENPAPAQGDLVVGPAMSGRLRSTR